MMMNQLISIGYCNNKLMMMKGLWYKLKSGVRLSCLWKHASSAFGSLPDDVVFEILISLPAEQIRQCRKVCKHWNSLTSTPLFTETHFKTNSDNPSIVLLFTRRTHLGRHPHIFLFDEWGEPVTSNRKGKRVVIKSSCPKAKKNWIDGLSLRFYKDGMLTFVPHAQAHCFVLYNPTTRQQLVLHNDLGSACACFYHSIADEYRVLFYRYRADSIVEFHILSLNTLSCRRLSNFNLAPTWGMCEAIRTCYSNNEVLYWVSKEKDHRTTLCSRYFLMFDVVKEEFSSMSHPGDICTADCNVHSKLFPFEFKSGDGSLLSLCDCSIQDQIDMWVLEDHEKRSWVKRHSILLDLTVNRSLPDPRDLMEAKPFGVLNGEMLINLSRRGVFSYNFTTGNFRKIIDIVDGGIGFERDGGDCVLHVGLIKRSLVSFPRL